MAAVNAWKQYGAEPDRTLAEAISRYVDLWSYYDGSWDNDPRMQAQKQRLPRLYDNTRLLWRHARSTVRLYAQTVYLGPLSTDGKPLPDGTLGAIPLDPQVTGDRSDARNQALLKACAELWTMWNWRRYKSFRPKVAAILGDSLTELVDDVDRGKVFPRTIWPGYVTDDLELDDAGNVKRYVLEYQVQIVESTAFGQTVKGETYRFRKEVDGEAFRYFKDDKPFDYFGPGSAVQENFYGFVPAIWDRMEIGWGNRGIGVLDQTWRQAREMNSMLSHAMDYQRKQFAAPIVVAGRIVTNRNSPERVITMPRPAESGDRQTDAEATSERLDILEVTGEGGGISSILFDLGQTKELLAFLQESIYAENPEGKAWDRLREQSQVTGPGAERMIGDIVGLIKDARDSLDPGTVALHQMAIAIIGERLRRGDYAPAVLTSRHEAFRDFDLDSWRRGQLDMIIRDRPVIPESEREKVDRIVQVESLETEWAMQQAGVPEEAIRAMVADRDAQQEAREAALERRFNAGLSRPAGSEEGDAA